MKILKQDNAQLQVQVATSAEVVEATTRAAEQMKEQMLALQTELQSYKKISYDLDVDKRRMADQLERNVEAVSRALRRQFIEF